MNTRNKNENEYEIVTHGIMKGFKIFLVDLTYRTPHMHSDFELNFLLKGSASIASEGKTIHLQSPDFFIVNPFKTHEIRTDTSAMFLSIQTQPSFFRDYFPEISHVDFPFASAKSLLSADIGEPLFLLALSMAIGYFEMQNGFQLYCAAKLNEIFYTLLTTMPHTIISNKEYTRQKQSYERVRRISSYIDAHFNEKLLLQDIAENEQLSMTYLSHFFKDHFQMSFQEYLLHLRCEKARQLLLSTDHNLLDISFACGFSDVKYLNKGFLSLYHISPKDFRKQNPSQLQPVPKEEAFNNTQQFLYHEESLKILRKIRDDEINHSL